MQLLPSIKMSKISLKMVMVVAKTKKEKTNVQMGSAILYSG